MAFVFDRRLAIPLWAIACFAVVLPAPPSVTPFAMPTLLVTVAVGIAAIALSIPGCTSLVACVSRARSRASISTPRSREHGVHCGTDTDGPA